MQPLHGITVVALEHAVAIPFTTRQLADLGARVIKVERPGVGDFARDYDRTVDGEASYFVWLNRGKESLALDIKDPGDRKVLDTLIGTADVFVNNLGPGAIDRLGLDASTLRAANPRLIHCSVSGYGTSGPYRDKKAYDLLIQCETGVLSVTGTPQDPSKVGFSVADVAAGMYAYTGILTALYERERTGVGSTLDVAMIDALGEWMTQPAYYSAYGNKPTRRTGAQHASISPYGPYECADGEQVFLGIQNDREWARLCTEVIERPDLVEDPRFVHNPDRVAHDEQLTSVLLEAFSSTTADRVAELLEGVGIANARMRQAGELLDHPQLQARNRWRTVSTPAGRIKAMVPPVNVQGREPSMGPVPALGEHTESIRAELGLDEPAQATA